MISPFQVPGGKHVLDKEDSAEHHQIPTSISVLFLIGPNCTRSIYLLSPVWSNSLTSRNPFLPIQISSPLH